MERTQKCDKPERECRITLLQGLVDTLISEEKELKVMKSAVIYTIDSKLHNIRVKIGFLEEEVKQVERGN